jgi:putative ABC transport system permease protein
MLILKLALRTLARRKGRMALIGSLVAFGTFLIVFGTIFADSAGRASRAAIIDSFTGDFIVYSDRSKDLPSPFAFNSPLPRIRDAEAVEAALAAMPEVEAYAPYSQNYGIIQVERGGAKVDLPFIFYAVEPDKYLKVFGAVNTKNGSFFGRVAEGVANGADSAGGAKSGVMVSAFQNAAYMKGYGVELSAGESVTLLGITEGGVNAVRSSVVGLFEPAHFTSVFNYINFMDSGSYARLYDYSGVEALPEAFDKGLAAADSAGSDEEAIFALANDPAMGSLDLGALKSQSLSGATMIAVRLKDHAVAPAVIARLQAMPGLGVKAAGWEAASGFYAQIASALQAFIYLATALVFLVVILIFMNTLIINVTERTAEIGTMRAIGSDKSFIRGLFLTEALALNIASALVGMALTGAALIAFGRGGLRLPEVLSQFLIGGGALRLHASAAPFTLGLAAVALVSVLATLYPVSVATSITPLKAMSDK